MSKCLVWLGSHLLWVNLHQLAGWHNVQCCNVLPIVQCKGRVQSSCPDGHWQPGVNLFSICDKCWEHCQELSGPRAGLAAHDTRCRRLSTQKFVNAIITWYNSVINGGETYKWENGMWHLFNFSSGKCNANNNLRESLQIDLQFPRPKSTNLGCKRISKYLEATHHSQY